MFTALRIASKIETGHSEPRVTTHHMATREREEEAAFEARRPARTILCFLWWAMSRA